MECEADTPAAIVTIQGKKLECRFERRWHTFPPSRKGLTLTSFSRKSRLRLLKNVATIDWRNTRYSLFVTLTYPDDAAHRDKDRRNRERYLMHRHFELYAGKHLCGIWRVEWKPRLTGKHVGRVEAHQHMVLFDCPYIGKKTIRKWWARILNMKGYVDVDSKTVPAGEAASMYVSKYCAKVDVQETLGNLPYLNTPGRHYGYFRSKQIPRCEKISFPLINADFIRLIQIRASTRLKYLDTRFQETFTLLGDFAVQVGDEILKKAIDASTAK